MHPILFEIGPFTIRTYGVLVAVAFLTGFLLIYKEARKENFYPNKILDLELVILIFGIIGARLLHILVNMDFYSKNLFEVFLIWKGGLALYGGLILAVAAGWVFLLANKIPVKKTGDLIAPYIALGQSIGRIGCFLNGCCYGKPIGNTSYIHPTQIYASAALIIAFVVLKIAQKKPPFNGFVFFLYLVLYSFQRFFIDFLRADTPVYFGSLTISQIISIGVFLLGTGFIARGLSRRRA